MHAANFYVTNLNMNKLSFSASGNTLIMQLEFESDGKEIKVCACLHGLVFVLSAAVCMHASCHGCLTKRCALGMLC